MGPFVPLAKQRGLVGFQQRATAEGEGTVEPFRGSRPTANASRIIATRLLNRVLSNIGDLIYILVF